ncbi:MAG TPA: head GIN domain-containing protein, partial [Chitinophagaceae bacterium]
MRQTALFIVLILIFTTSCRYMGWRSVTGNGILSKQERNIGDFRGVEVTGNMEVIISAGAENSVRVEADENLMQHIDIDRDGDVLVIAPEKGYNLRPRAGIKIYLTAPSFETLAVTGSGKIRSESKIVSNNKISADVTGSGDILVEADAPEIRTDITGSGTIKIKGATRLHTTEISGSGDVQCFELLSEKTTVDIAGSGNVQVF